MSTFNNGGVCGSSVVAKARAGGLCSARYEVRDLVEPWTPDLDLGTEASGATPSST